MATTLTELITKLDQYLLLFPSLKLFQPEDLKTPYSHHTTITFLHATPQDLEVIDTVVAERQSQLTDLTREIEQVQVLTQKLNGIQAKLEERQSHVQASLTFHRALTRPIRRLCPEILGEIFQLCLPQSSYIAPRINDCPMVLTRVCQRWRSVAMAIPWLWSSLSIHLPDVVKHEYRLGCDTWLTRARGIPLTICIWDDEYVSIDTSSADLTHHLINWIQCLTARSRKFRWHATPLENLLPLGEAVELLETLEISIRTHRIPPIHVPGPANRLKTLCLKYSYDLHAITRDITLPWEQLTEIDMQALLINITTCLRLLEICTCLQSATLSCVAKGFRSYFPIPGGIVNHSLKVLKVKTETTGVAGLLFDELLLPSLEALQTSFRYVDGEWPYTQFASFLTRSRCPLEKLTISDIESPTFRLSEVQAMLPSLSVYLL